MLVDAGIQLKSVRVLNLFKFSDALQERLETLNEKKRQSSLTTDEEIEPAGILELDRIFTLLNARVIAESV
ncbi:MAG: hypothetical protein Q6L60_00890 [Thermostichus sp. HHBFW_bins_43]